MFAYINPKYLILEMAPWDLPYVILSVATPPEMAAVAKKEEWGPNTPPLLFVPATAPGVIAWASYTRARIKAGQIQAEPHQRLALKHVLLANTPVALQAIAQGNQQFAAGKKLDPSWIPEPDSIWLDPVIHCGKKPWDGFTKWAERYRSPEESEPLTSAEPKPTLKPTKTTKPKRTDLQELPFESQA